MKWSKLKQKIEERFVESAKGRIEVFQTRYRNSHDQVGEYWITLDGKKIDGYGDLSFFTTEAKSIDDRYWKEENKNKQIWEIQDDVHRELMEDGILSTGAFYNFLKESLSMSVDDLLKHDYPIIRVFGILDSRCGKRRLAKINITNEHPLVEKIYIFRNGLI